MSGLAVHRTPSAGAIIKKMLEINPELGVSELALLIRQATSRRGSDASEYADVEVIDEGKALALARQASLQASRRMRSP